MSKIKDLIIDEQQKIDDTDYGIEYCASCQRKLPPPVREERAIGISEYITYCPCGVTYT